jgi:hypothetical protein
MQPMIAVFFTYESISFNPSAIAYYRYVDTPSNLKLQSDLKASPLTLWLFDCLQSIKKVLIAMIARS